VSTFTAVLEPQPDGTVHVPVPEELRHNKVQVVATLAAAPEVPAKDECNAHLRGFGALAGKISISEDFDEPLADFKEYMGRS
jgi:hypothetical protein